MTKEKPPLLLFSAYRPIRLKSLIIFSKRRHSENSNTDFRSLYAGPHSNSKKTLVFSKLKQNEFQVKRYRYDNKKVNIPKAAIKIFFVFFCRNRRGEFRNRSKTLDYYLFDWDPLIYWKSPFCKNIFVEIIKKLLYIL